MFDAGKTRMIGLQYGEKTMTIRLSRYSTGTLRTDGRTDRYQYRASVWWRAIKTGAEMLRRSVIVWGNEFQTWGAACAKLRCTNAVRGRGMFSRFV